MGHPAIVAGEASFSLASLMAYRGVFVGGKAKILLRKALDTSIRLRVASLTLTLKYPQNSYAELRPQVFNPVVAANTGALNSPPSC
jgi:hypothetical protein